MEEEIVEVIELLYTDEELDRQMEKKIDKVVHLLYADKKEVRRLDGSPDGMQGGMDGLAGKMKRLRFRP